MERLLFFARRCGKAVLVILFVIAINFALIRAAPGDPATILAGESGAVDAGFVERVRKDYGLDRPLPVQLFTYMKQLLSFDLGNSYRENRPVKEIILEKLPATLLLTLSAFVFSIAVGVGLGIAAARRAGSALDALITAGSLVFFAMPLFWFGLLAIVLFSVKLGWLPPYGMSTVGADLEGWRAWLDTARHLLMPAATLGLFYVAVYTRVTRAAAMEVMDQDFVKTAHAKGVPESRIWRRHILRNAILPVITFVSLQAGHILGGSVLVETVFAWPGIGRLAFDALFQRDYNLLLAVFFVSSVMVVVFNLVADLLYSLADPRIELQK
ncbi:peptide/nickel transport system permease protein [Variovorax boronicumulans]|uniref:Peptide/nickel transport system permease protein n=1 Tax=Variovorax boronicumulans TaxID=436515 RepID=A0AAW8DTM6_9BURK|nr:ABC transporter permease [Variovorax boronicumulans]MDP9877583.1 peptide/nickel transport system permease protein [Variovorax boronicumulans]MDP9917439.1 peptide/nickel transport system permease protein [Variovorax boronicumulans]MDP9922868.1 peptide/nickel transport system permease protein [Variovorax boronicumulans]